IRPAAASSRSRGPGGRAPGPHASLSRGQLTARSPRPAPRTSRTHRRMPIGPSAAACFRLVEERMRGGCSYDDLTSIGTGDCGGPILVSNRGSNLASAEGLFVLFVYFVPFV